ncbi:hypothetical protein GGR56DRAFT_56360 [Xylariaceae sp. FL0804]|nr:hypothetical protein GGR56DRAFT_56360 [Xylariaceae sp. FL0804]
MSPAKAGAVGASTSCVPPDTILQSCQNLLFVGITMLFPSLLSLLAFTGQATATTWYYLLYEPASGQEFTQLSGTMTIPELPEAATYYLWPGLQPTDSSGVYQDVLDGRSGTWWIGSGWCCSNPTLDWGGGFNVYEGDTVAFTNIMDSDGEWTTTLTSSNGDSVTNTFDLEGKSFNQAIFAIELDGPTWDFGQLAYSDITITSNGTDDSSWCNDSPTNYDSAAAYSVSGVSATVSDVTVTCTISSLILESPA